METTKSRVEGLSLFREEWIVHLLIKAAYDAHGDKVIVTRIKSVFIPTFETHLAKGILLNILR